jgi:hypothetical protein
MSKSTSEPTENRAQPDESGVDALIERALQKRNFKTDSEVDDEWEILKRASSLSEDD